MKAVIMAGGEGTRLRPLTLTMPKPLVPIAGRPAMTHILELLANHGVTEAAVTVKYLGDMIEKEYGGSRLGVNLSYFYEDKPLGTAGSVKNTSEFLLGGSNKSGPTDYSNPSGYSNPSDYSSSTGDSGRETDSFLVISGDAVCDIDLTAALRFHREKGADATIILSRVTEPLEYGVVVCGVDGRIERFIEKPSWQQAYSDTVNTGIYILSADTLRLIPDGPYDFGRDLFPSMLAAGKKLYGIVDLGYWCDVGDLGAFYRCNFERANTFSGAKEEPRETDVIIGQNCDIAKSAVITRSIIFDGVKISSDCVIDGGIICEGASLGSGVIVRPGCVIGAGSELGDNVSVAAGVKVWNGKKVGGGITLTRNLVFGEAKHERALFGERGIGLGEAGGGLAAPYCVSLGEAVAAAAGEGARIGILSPEGGSCGVVKQAVICGIYAGGGRACDFGEGFDAMASYAASRFKLDLMLCVRENANGSIDLDMYDHNGLYPDRVFERKLAAFMARADAEPPKVFCHPEEFGALRYLYSSELAGSCGVSLAGMTAVLNDSAPSRLLAEVLRELGAAAAIGEKDIKHDLRITINEAGEELALSEQSETNQTFTADRWHIAAIIEQAELNSGARLIVLPYTAPKALEELARGAGAEVARYTRCPHDSSESKIRARAAAQIWMRDACFAALRICALMVSGKITLRKLSEQLPDFHSEVSDFDAEYDIKTTVLRELGGSDVVVDVASQSENTETAHFTQTAKDSSAEFLSAEEPKVPPAAGRSAVNRYGEGISLDYGKAGRVNVIPKRDRGFTLIADAFNMEAASEIMELTRAKLDEIISGVR